MSISINALKTPVINDIISNDCTLDLDDMNGRERL